MTDHSRGAVRAPQAYEAPRVTRLGKVESWTKGAAQGLFTDRDFPVHTPTKDLTFTLIP